MMWLHLILLIFSGLLAISSWLVTRHPNSRGAIERLVPFQALIGVALLASGLILWIRLGITNVFRWIGHAPLFGVTLVAMIGSAILLGFLFGMPQLASWIPGESKAETAALDLSRKLGPIKVLLGAIALGAAVLGLLFTLNILAPH